MVSSVLSPPGHGELTHRDRLAGPSHTVIINYGVNGIVVLLEQVPLRSHINTTSSVWFCYAWYTSIDKALLHSLFFYPVKMMMKRKIEKKLNIAASSCVVSFRLFRNWGKLLLCLDFTPSFHNFVDCIISAPNLQTPLPSNKRISDWNQVTENSVQNVKVRTFWNSTLYSLSAQYERWHKQDPTAHLRRYIEFIEMLTHH